METGGGVKTIGKSILTCEKQAFHLFGGAKRFFNAALSSDSYYFALHIGGYKANRIGARRFKILWGAIGKHHFAYTVRGAIHVF